MSFRSKDIPAFLLGAAAGLVIGYFLNSDKMEEVVADLKEKAKKIKNELEEQLEKGRDLVSTLSSKAEAAIDKLESKD